MLRLLRPSSVTSIHRYSPSICGKGCRQLPEFFMLQGFSLANYDSISLEQKTWNILHLWKPSTGWRRGTHFPLLLPMFQHHKRSNDLLFRCTKAIAQEDSGMPKVTDFCTTVSVPCPWRQSQTASHCGIFGGRVLGIGQDDEDLM